MSNSKDKLDTSIEKAIDKYMEAHNNRNKILTELYTKIEDNKKAIEVHTMKKERAFSDGDTEAFQNESVEIEKLNDEIKVLDQTLSNAVKKPIFTLEESTKLLDSFIDNFSIYNHDTKVSLQKHFKAILEICEELIKEAEEVNDIRRSICSVALQNDKDFNFVAKYKPITPYNYTELINLIKTSKLYIK